MPLAFCPLALLVSGVGAAASPSPPSAPLVKVACERGVYDCDNSDIPAGTTTCADYDVEYPTQKGNVALLGFAAVVAAAMCFCIGGNDSANSWASSVGSGAISLRRAVLLGGFCEWLGATLLGYGVSSTIQKGVADIDDPDCWACGYCDSEMSVYALGMLAALIGAALFLCLATFGKMPVSTTHAIVGGVVGMTIVGTSASCLNWAWVGGLSSIIASWVISPLLSGLIATVILLATKRVAGRHPVRNTLRALPFLYAVAVFVMVLLIMLKSKPTKSIDKAWMLLAAFVAALAVGLVVLAVVVPRVRRQLERMHGASGAAPPGGGLPAAPDGAGKAGTELATRADAPNISLAMNDSFAMDDGAREGAAGERAAPDKPTALVPYPSNSQMVAVSEDDKATKVYSNLLVFVAALESFAHGANDTANGTAAFAAVYNSYAYGHGDLCSANDETPWWIMAIAGAFVALGVNTMGYRVIQTLGSEITTIDYRMGFAIEFASTFTVVIATVLGLPVSSTHCQVGAVVFTGLVSSSASEVRWSLFGKIALSWVLTLPFAGGLAAGLTAAFRAGMRTHDR